MLASSADQKDQRTAVGIAALDDGSEPAVGFGPTEQSGRFEVRRQTFSQAGIRRDR